MHNSHFLHHKITIKMSAISVSNTLSPSLFTSCSPPLTCQNTSISYPFLSPKSHPHPLFSSFSSPSRKKSQTLIFSNSSNQEPELSSSNSIVEEEDEWLKKLPDKKLPVYSHSLPCIEAWLRSLGFYQSEDDLAVWLVEMPDWHARLSLDVTDFYIRYLKSGPGKIEKDVERRFSYALSREDVENAMLGGP